MGDWFWRVTCIWLGGVIGWSLAFGPWAEGEHQARLSAAQARQEREELPRRRDWASLAETRVLSNGDELSRVVLASPIDRSFDVVCLRLQTQSGQVLFQCPGAGQEDLRR